MMQRIFRLGRSVAACAHRVAARRNVHRNDFSSSSTKALIPKFIPWRTDRFFMAGALATVVVLTSTGDGECASRKKRLEKHHGKRLFRIKSLRTLFNLLDAEDTNSICINDLIKFLTENDAEIGSSEEQKLALAKTILRRGDFGNESEGMHGETHGDELMSFKEFSAFVLTLLRSIFEIVDIDDSGAVDGSEIRRVLQIMYGDDYMDRVRDNKELEHKATRDIFVELTREDTPDMTTAIHKLAFVDFILHVVVTGEHVDLPALARLIRSVSDDDAVWHAVRLDAVESISDMSEAIDTHGSE